MLNLFNRINIKFDDVKGVIIINTVNMELPVMMSVEDSLKDKHIVKLMKPLDVFKMGMYCSQCKHKGVTQLNEDSGRNRIKLIEVKNDGVLTYKLAHSHSIEKDHINHVINSKKINKFSKNDIFRMGLMTGFFTKV